MDTLLLAGVGERIGAAVARRFHTAGWAVALVARSGDVTDPLAAELDRAVAIRADITDEAAVERAVATTHDVFGPVDCLVANASAGGGNPVEAATPETFERLWRVRAFGTFLLAQACLDDLTDGGTLLASGTTYATDPPTRQVEWGSAAPATQGLVATLDAAVDGLDAVYVQIGAAVSPPDSDFPGAIGADTLADRYLDLADGEPTAELTVRIDTS